MVLKFPSLPVVRVGVSAMPPTVTVAGFCLFFLFVCFLNVGRLHINYTTKNSFLKF